MDDHRVDDLAQLSPAAQRALLARMLQQRAQPTLAPLSFAQERFWLLHQLDPASPAYVMFGALRLRGPLATEHLRTALARLVERHEPLRTTFVDQDGQPQQRIGPPFAPDVPLHDLASLPSDQRETAAQTLLVELAHQPIDLHDGPLLRTTLIRLDAAEHLLAIALHHIAGDGWSLDVFVRELAALYDAARTDTPLTLPALPLQYAQFARWQRQWLQGATLQRLLDFWQQQLGPDDNPAPQVLALPTDYPRPPFPSFRGATVPFSLPSALAADLRALSRAHDATLFVTLLAAFQTLLARYSDQWDLLVGTPVAGRTRPELEGLIGPFANTLVLRGQLQPTQPFDTLLTTLQATLRGALDHQELPFERLVEAVQHSRDWSRAPLVQVLFVLQPVPAPIVRGPLRWEVLDPDRRTAKFDLVLALVETANGLRGQIEYSTDLFSAERIGRLIGHFETLLTAVVAAPSTALGALPLLTAAEHAQLTDWNGTAAPLPPVTGVPALIAEQAARTPDAVAVIAGAATLRYSELIAAATTLGQRLRDQGVEPEARVAVYLERSAHVVVALLGIWDAECVYVPLDANSPAERLAFLLADSAPQAVLTTQALAANLPPTSATVICLDADAPATAATHTLRAPRSPHSAAYMIYTSGSTGQPKGVLVEHGSLLNMVTSFLRSYTLTPDDRVLHQTALSFDASLGELLPVLCAGGAIVIAQAEQSGSFEAVMALLAEQQVTILGAVPALLRHLNQRLRGLPQVRLILSGGETLVWGDVDQLVQQARVTNGYGPTETTVCASYQEVTAIVAAATDDAEAGRTSTVAIGRPVQNTTIYLLDAQMQPVPVGVPGELCIGGVQLARGYHGQPALTAEKFLPDPFSDNGARLYRSGDLAVYQPDGTIVFLGRIDQQVKVRGFRIELGEIEAVLHEHPAIREAAVVVHEPTPGQKRLVAYVVEEPRTKNQEPGDGDEGTREQRNKAEHGVRIKEQEPTSAGDGTNEQRNNVREGEADGSQFSVLGSSAGSQFSVLGSSAGSSDLRTFLQHKLPEYMIPAVFIALDALPKMASGKVNRKALPTPSGDEAESHEAFVAPETAFEHALAQIWIETLGVERVGVHDNFFELGGDSLLSMVVISKARQAGYMLTPKQVLQHQTIRELAAVAETSQADQAEADDAQDEQQAQIPLMPLQCWYFEHRIAYDRNHWNITGLFEIGAACDAERWQQALHAVVAYHPALRSRFTQTDSGWHEWITERDETPLTTIDLSALPTSEQAAAIEARAAQLQTSLHIEDGPLLRLALFDLGQDRPGRLLIVAHHLVVDVTSWRIVVEDLQQAYAQVSRGESIRLQPKTTSFVRWANRLVEHAQSAEMRQELSYWLGLPWQHVASLPRDHPAGINIERAFRKVRLSLSVDTTQALLHELPRALGIQVVDVLLAAMARTFAQWTGSSALLVETLGHGREGLFDDIDLSRTVGWLASHTPMLIDLDAQTATLEALDQVKHQRTSLPNRGIGFGVLRYLCADADVRARLQALPQPEVFFNYLGQVSRNLIKDSMFRLAPESPGPLTSDQNVRLHLMTWTSLIVDEQLSLKVEYCEQVYEQATVEGLAEQVLATVEQVVQDCQAAIGSDAGGSFVPAGQTGRASAAVSGPLPISPNQALSFETPDPDRHIWNIAGRFEVDQPLDPDLLRQAVRAVLVQHEALRIRSIPTGDGWRQEIVAPDQHVPCTYHDLSALSASEQRAAIERTAAELQRSLNLEHGPVMGVALMNLGPEQPQRLMLVIHHTVCDGYSWQIVWQDLIAAYQQLARGAAVQLPPKTTSLTSYLERLAQHTRSGALDHELAYWLAEPRQRAPRLPVDHLDGVHTGATEQILELTLSRDETRALRKRVSASNHTRLLDLLLAALVESMTAWTGADTLLLDLEQHGHESVFDEIDLSRTVGWLNYRVPLLLERRATSSADELVQSIAAQRRGLPQRGIGYGLLRYLRGDDAIAAQLRALPQPEILFNYHGQFAPKAQSTALTYRPADESLGISYGLRFTRRHLLLIDVRIAQEQLRMRWTYGQQVHRRATIERVMQDYHTALRRLSGLD